MVAEIASRSIAGGPRGVRRAPDLADNAVLVARELLSPTVARLVVRPDAGVGTFVAGQYLALGVRVDDRIVQRPYSTASDPAAADAHEFLVRRVPDGALTPQLWALPVGARVRLGSPKGAFTLVAGDQRPHLFVATGPAWRRSSRCSGRWPGARTRRGPSSSTALPGRKTWSVATRSRPWRPAACP